MKKFPLLFFVIVLVSCSNEEGGGEETPGSPPLINIPIGLPNSNLNPGPNPNKNIKPLSEGEKKAFLVGLKKHLTKELFKKAGASMPLTLKISGKKKVNLEELCNKLVDNPNFRFQYQLDGGSFRKIAAITLAVGYDKADFLKHLLKHPRVDKNLKDENGYSPIAIAANHWESEIEDVLLNSGGIDLKRIQESPLMNAVHARNLKRLEDLLTNKKFDVNSKDVNGETALIRAAKSGNLDISKRLLKEKNLKINATDDHGNTAFHVVGLYGAYTEQAKEIAKLLLKQGASLKIKNKKGEIPEESAASYGGPEIQQIIKNWP